MLGIDLEQTRVYQEAKAEGRQEGIQEGRQKGIQEGREALQSELVWRMLARGMSQQEVAELLGLTLEQVRKFSQQKV